MGKIIPLPRCDRHTGDYGPSAWTQAPPGYRVIPEADRVIGQGRGTDAEVEDALTWLHRHPGTDYLDAAAAIVYRNCDQGRDKGWPEFVAKVRDAAAAMSWQQPGVEPETPHGDRSDQEAER